MSDFNLMQYGPVFTLDPLTDNAKAWIHYNIENPVPWGSGIVIEETDIISLVERLTDASLTVKVPKTLLASHFVNV